MYGKIKNPLTGRFVKTTSRLGQSIIKSYINQLGGNVCGVNPKTNRCNKKFSENSPELCEIGPKGRCKKKMNAHLIQKAMNRGNAPWPKKIDLEASLPDADRLGLLYNYDLSDEEHDELYRKLGNLKYDPEYESKFGNGQVMNIINYNPEDVLWSQASDKLDAYLKYGDALE